MPPRHRRSDLHEHVVAIMDETGVDDPFEAVRIKARAVIEGFHQTFSTAPPFCMNTLASFRGLHLSNDDPRFSPDSEIAPEADGKVVLRVNNDRPLCRQRFSIGHEIGHTLFPEYQLAVRCRKPENRNWAAPDDLLETLCDVAASELMFPTPWFTDRIASIDLSAKSLAELADEYEASRESMVRRFVELHTEPLAAVFLSWKLKPVEKRTVTARKKTKPLFPGMETPEPAPMLRVDYRITNEAFDSTCSDYIPRDKSVPSEGPIYEASIDLTPHDGNQELDFGRLSRRFLICALPVYTAETDVGPDGESSVVAVLRPM